MRKVFIILVLLIVAIALTSPAVAKKKEKRPKITGGGVVQNFNVAGTPEDVGPIYLYTTIGFNAQATGPEDLKPFLGYGDVPVYPAKGHPLSAICGS